MTDDENTDSDPEDDDDITVPLWRCKNCGERFEDPISMPPRVIQEPNRKMIHKQSSKHCPFCRSGDLERPRAPR